MSTILIASGDAEARDVNQYGLAFNNVLGVADTAQSTVGRLVMPRSTAPPFPESEGQFYWDTNDQALYYFEAVNAWIRALGVRQAVYAPVEGNRSVGRDPTSVVRATIETTGGSVLVVGVLGWYGQRDSEVEDDNEIRIDSSLLSIDAEGVEREVDRASDVRWGVSDQWLIGQLHYHAFELPAAPGEQSYDLRVWSGDAWRTVTARGLARGGGYYSALVLLEVG